MCAYLRRQKREINLALENTQKDIARVGEKFSGALASALPFSLVWLRAEGDVMALMGEVCSSGKEGVAVVEITDEAENLGEIPEGGILTLVTNGIDRHRITATSPDGSGVVFGSMRGKYKPDGWAWCSIGGA